MPQYTKKSQIQMTETIMVLLVFFIILSISLVVYYQYQFKNILEFGKSTEQEKNSLLLFSVSSMPELKCSKRTDDEECIDLIKSLSFKQLITPEYNDYFGDIKVSIKQTYPSLPEEECTPALYQAKSCNTITLYNKAKSFRQISTPISLYHPHLDQYTIGELIITF